MSLIKLTQNLENFQWTDYSKAGIGKSPQQDGTPYFERPNPKSLEQMESKFGKLDTPPGTRGPYDTVDYMDGTKQGRGFIPPGSTPVGFDKDMDLIYSYDRSRLVLNGNISLFPLSHNIAGMNSALSYGIVSNQMINLEPAAIGAWGNSILPISTYTSRQPIEDMLVGPVGGRNTYYGNLDIPLPPSRRSQFQKGDGSYTTPTGDEFTKPGSGYLMNLARGTTFPSFIDEKGLQRTFLIPAAYPQNTLGYSIDSQFGWSHQSNYLESHGTAWRGFGLTTTAGGQMNSGGSGHPNEDFTVNKIYFSSEPNYNAPSWLALQFLTDVSDTAGIWPYHVLSYFNPNTTGPHVEDHHPIIRKGIGQRYQIGGISDWMALQVARTLDDIDRISGFDNDSITGWLETPKGELWITKQHTLQALNPREETRDWSVDNLTYSLPPFMHIKRHSGLFGGGTYMEEADFGNVLENIEKDAFGQGLLDKLDKVAGALGHIDFNASFGRLNYLRNRFIMGSGTSKDSFFTFSNPFNTDPMTGLDIDEPNFTVGAGHLNLTDILNGATPFGRPPKIPSQTTFSQRGAFGKGPINQQTAETGVGGHPIQRYKSLTYGELGSKYSKFDSPFLGRNRAPGGLTGLDSLALGDPLEAGDLTDAEFSAMEAEYHKNLALQKKDSLTITQLNTAVDEYRKNVGEAGKIHHDVGHQGKQMNLVEVPDNATEGAGLGSMGIGNIKKDVGQNNSDGSYKSMATDKVNMHPYGPWDGPDDFIKFKFYDTVNKKYIIFRAILSGISDSISPEWSGTRYIGRPDQVYVYQGTERSISFSFDVYPKTKQEFPVLMEKLNYLIGLCYPSYHNNRMIPPFINFTLGDMFVGTPGFLNSLSLEVNDTGTWEIAKGFQFPKHITCQCEFQYIGSHPQITTGKHYDLGWIPTDSGDANWSDTRWWPNRGGEPDNPKPIQKLFDSLGQTEADATIT